MMMMMMMMTMIITVVFLYLIYDVLLIDLLYHDVLEFQPVIHISHVMYVSFDIFLHVHVNV